MTAQDIDPEKNSEDHAFRSAYVRKLVQAPPAHVQTSQQQAIPRTLVQFWDEPDHIPDDVAECLRSWQQVHQEGIRRLLFNAPTARDYLRDRLGNTHVQAFDACYHPAMQCDYFRLCYIFTSGGFYVDADEVYQGTGCGRLYNDGHLKLQPLCYDLSTGLMIDPGDFTRSTSPSWIFYFNNNPIIAPPEHPVLRLALDRATRLLLSTNELQEIQSTTGPGNLTASVVRYALQQDLDGNPANVAPLSDWTRTSISPWGLGYRQDGRNWRLANEKPFTRTKATVGPPPPRSTGSEGT
jgi:hypothetical protein